MADAPETAPAPTDGSVPAPAPERRDWVWRNDRQGYFRVGRGQCVHPVSLQKDAGGPFFLTEGPDEELLPGRFDTLDAGKRAFDLPRAALSELAAQKGDALITLADLDQLQPVTGSASPPTP